MKKFIAFLIPIKKPKSVQGYSQGKDTLKLNSSAYEKYEYGHLDRWYIKLALFKRFLNWNKFSKKIKKLLAKLHSL